jgi:hypothetical protein
VVAYGRVGSYPLIVTVGLELDRELASWRSRRDNRCDDLGGTLLLIAAAYLIRRIFDDAPGSRDDVGDHPYGRA